MKSAFLLSGELGFAIALPILTFSLAGRFLDKYFDTSPWLLIVSLAFSFPVVAAIITQKIKRLTR